VVRADTGAEYLEAAAGSGRFNDWSRAAGDVGEFFRDGLGVRKHRGGTDNLDLIAGNGRAGECSRGHQHGSRYIKGLHKTLPSVRYGVCAGEGTAGIVTGARLLTVGTRTFYDCTITSL